ncbi:Protein phosphatase 2C 2, partial [Mortierella sp. GBA43]
MASSTYLSNSPQSMTLLILKPAMEDAHNTLLDVEDAPGIAFFAVYDGHGGSGVAKYCGEHLHRNVIADPAFVENDYRTAIRNGFLETDRGIQTDIEGGGDKLGSTAITATITDDNVIFVASPGIVLTIFARHPDESVRIFTAGGYVENGRINGGLAVSRALGDFDLKLNSVLRPDEQIVVANPDIVEHELTDEDEFLVLACDGIWDCMSSRSVISFVRQEIANKTPLDKICEMTMDRCLAKDKLRTQIGLDNMTMVIVAFLDGMTVDEWYDH